MNTKKCRRIYNCFIILTVFFGLLFSLADLVLEKSTGSIIAVTVILALEIVSFTTAAVFFVILQIKEKNEKE